VEEKQDWAPSVVAADRDPLVDSAQRHEPGVVNAGGHCAFDAAASGHASG
jgi:hypothetical protein